MRSEQLNNNSGVALIEAAIVIPLVLLFFLAIADISTYIRHRTLVENAVQRTGRFEASQIADCSSSTITFFQSEAELNLKQLMSQVGYNNSSVFVSSCLTDPVCSTSDCTDPHYSFRLEAVINMNCFSCAILALITGPLHVKSKIAVPIESKIYCDLTQSFMCNSEAGGSNDS